MNAAPGPDPTALLDPLRRWTGARVVVGVSGGADSVALLRALLRAGALPVVAHFDHALRPDSAGDAAWVRDLAARLGADVQTVRVDVAAVAARRGWNLEDAARRLRYDFLTRVARQSGAAAVLTAHTRRDQAETVLVRLLRGEAVLTGIAPQWGRAGQIHRPWLDVPRADLERWLHSLGQDWREDPSNADPAYTRAWIRQEVMPRLLARFPAAEEALARVARTVAEDDAALSALAGRLQAHTPLHAQSAAVLRRWLRRELASVGLDVHTGHLRTLTDALHQRRTAHLTLPGGRAVTVTGGKLYTAPQTFAVPDFAPPPGWTLRTRQPGDRVRLPGGTRKLSDVLTDAQVPRDSRPAVPLLVSPGGEVGWVGLTPPVWAVGVRDALKVPADPDHAAMGEALALAREAADHAEVPIGAVVLGPGGAVIGRGRNTCREDGDMTRHAELAALRDAARTLGTPYLTDCTLVVTLEPCPMCLGAALEARVGAVVYGAANPRAGALGGVTDLLAAHWGHRPAVRVGVRGGEAARLLRGAFAEFRRGVEAGAEAEEAGSNGI